MMKTQGNVLKSNDVEVEGRFLLDVATPQQTPLPRKGPNQAPPQVRITENKPEYAVLELTCSCGAKSYIRCQYNNPGTPNSEIQ